MGIFRAIGLGIAIVVLKFLTPEIFAGIETTLITFFEVFQLVLVQVPTDISNVASVQSVGHQYMPDIPPLHNINLGGYQE